ncbi:polar growth protein, partial [Ceratobasidium sp. 423]
GAYLALWGEIATASSPFGPYSARRINSSNIIRYSSRIGIKPQPSLVQVERVTDSMSDTSAVPGSCGSEDIEHRRFTGVTYRPASYHSPVPPSDIDEQAAVDKRVRAAKRWYNAAIRKIEEDTNRREVKAMVNAKRFKPRHPFLKSIHSARLASRLAAIRARAAARHEDKTREFQDRIYAAHSGHPVRSSCNIPTIPLATAQQMNPAPRPPSPSEREAAQQASRRENPNQLSWRDACILIGLPENGPPPRDPADKHRMNSFFVENGQELVFDDGKFGTVGTTTGSGFSSSAEYSQSGSSFSRASGRD